MTVAPWQTANYEDPRFLEHDNNITGPVYKYVPYDDGHARNINFVGRHPEMAWQVAGGEMTKGYLGKIGMGVNDTVEMLFILPQQERKV